MARSTALSSLFGIIPGLIFIVILGTGSYFGATSLMEQMPGSEMSCKVTQFEEVKNSNDLLIHTDGCSNDKVTEHIFRADRTKLEASFIAPATATDFYNGVKAGKTYNFVLQGITAKPLNMVPTVVKVTEDYMPY